MGSLSTAEVQIFAFCSISLIILLFETGVYRRHGLAFFILSASLSYLLLAVFQLSDFAHIASWTVPGTYVDAEFVTSAIVGGLLLQSVLEMSVCKKQRLYLLWYLLACALLVLASGLADSEGAIIPSNLFAVAWLLGGVSFGRYDGQLLTRLIFIIVPSSLGIILIGATVFYPTGYSAALSWYGIAVVVALAFFHYYFLRRYITHDPLTGLKNQRKFLLDVDRIISMKGGYAHVALADLTLTEEINRLFSHEQGEKVLLEASDRIQSLAEKNGVQAYHIDGSKFAYVASGVTTGWTIERWDRKVSGIWEDKVKELRLELNRPYLKPRNYLQECRIGISAYPDSLESPQPGKKGIDAESIFQYANAALLDARSSSSDPQVKCNRSLFHDEQKEARKRFETAGQFNHNKTLSQLVLHYQPQIQVEPEGLLGAEALIRWQKSKSELVYPDKFIDTLEKTSHIHTVSTWVYKEAFQQSTLWPKIEISFNVSAANMQNDQWRNEFIDYFTKHKIEKNHLKMELTETAFIHDQQAVIGFLKRAKALNFKVALDDYGTGHASLSVLKSLPIDCLKIDREFIKELGGPKKNSDAIVVNAIQLAKLLQISVVAEGADKQSHVDLLRDYRCDIIQGYIHSKPLPVPEFEAKYSGQLS
ncbi:MAG: EAL domain-containing protein [Halieaceae bacterium]|nr:EAL domain-containing protein [Halieaceae bacterium]